MEFPLPEIDDISSVEGDSTFGSLGNANEELKIQYFEISKVRVKMTNKLK